jgi:hypothetical protein
MVRSNLVLSLLAGAGAVSAAASRQAIKVVPGSYIVEFEDTEVGLFFNL